MITKEKLLSGYIELPISEGLLKKFNEAVKFHFPEMIVLDEAKLESNAIMYVAPNCLSVQTWALRSGFLSAYSGLSSDHEPLTLRDFEVKNSVVTSVEKGVTFQYKPVETTTSLFSLQKDFEEGNLYYKVSGDKFTEVVNERGLTRTLFGNKLYRKVEVNWYDECKFPVNCWVVSENGTAAYLRGVFKVHKQPDGKVSFEDTLGKEWTYAYPVSEELLEERKLHLTKAKSK
ncbi:hypothetical protein NVP1121O_041 [Vibrio phage 1.121.O._10N.286.46.C4]|nr:hypothetical protein NVP1121O_041 [Vibrio phage 1.121.O._10N.286.46.C4]